MTDFPRAHPEIRAMLPAPTFQLAAQPMQQVREYLESALPKPTVDPTIKTEHIEITGGAGQKMRMYCLQPADVVAKAPQPTVLAFHGGGGLIGTPEQEYSLYSSFVKAGYLVLSPEYRLAPEDPFPAANDDALKAWEWLSAGGALAASVALRLRETSGGVQPKIVLLDSPVLCDRATFHSQREGSGLEKYFWWTTENARDAQRLVFGSDHETLPLHGAPLRSTNAEDFKGLPPHYIAAGELDSLVDHSVTYANLLQAAGVSTELHVWRGAVHGFIHPGWATSYAQRAIGCMLAALADANAW
ncbi:hypothetical protein RQP46_002557 [Phenoliferia psychrophenolica]